MSPFRAKTGQVCLQLSFPYWSFLGLLPPQRLASTECAASAWALLCVAQDTGGRRTSANRKHVLPVVLWGITSFASGPVFL